MSRTQTTIALTQLLRNMTPLWCWFHQPQSTDYCFYEFIAKEVIQLFCS